MRAINKREAARLRKAKQRMRARAGDARLETVTFEAPSVSMAKLRAMAPLHPKGTLQAVLAEAVEFYARQTSQATQDIATLAFQHWPRIRPLLPYFTRLMTAGSPPITVLGRKYTHEDVRPLLPIYRDLVLRAKNLGHDNYVAYFDHLVGGPK